MSQDPLIGRVLLGQYTIEKRLGAGGFSTIYVADQPSLGRKVAIKTIHPHLATNADTVARFHREGLAISRLKHPAIVEVFNLGQAEDGLLWIAMEYLEGESFASRLQRQGKLPAAELVSMFRPVCEVLSEAHEQGIVHRDLKPENIMLMTYRGGWLPKVLDFGMSSLQDGSSQSSAMVGGTFAYMPPEQWQGLKYTDARSDIYAMGVIAYQALTGRLPIEADAGAFLQWAQKHLHEPPLPLTEVAPAIAAVIEKALQKDPAQRQQEIMEFWEALNQAVQASANQPNTTAQLGPPPAMSKPAAPNVTAPLGPPPTMKPPTIPMNATAQLGPPPAMSKPAAPNVTAPLGSPPNMKQSSAPVGAKPLFEAATPPSIPSGIPLVASGIPQAPGRFPAAPGASPIEAPKAPSVPTSAVKTSNKPNPSLGESSSSLRNMIKKGLAAEEEQEEQEEEEESEEEEWEPTFAYAILSTDGTLQAAYHLEEGPFALIFEDEEIKILTDFSPAYAYDSYGDLYCVITAKNGKIYGGTYDDDNCLQLKHIGGEARSNAAPSLTIWDEELCIAIKGTDNHVYIGFAEDLEDLEFSLVDEESTTIASPSIVAADGTLYCAITGPDNLLYITYSDDIDEFSFENVSDAFQTKQAPSLAYVGEQLFFGLTGVDNKPYLAVLDEDDAIEPWEIGGGYKTKLAPALATWEDTIYFALTNTNNTPCLALANAKERKPNKALRFYEVGDGASTRVSPGVASAPPPEYYEADNEEE
jgi:eukaryotic-like serine/threonine-protein kinase